MAISFLELIQKFNKWHDPKTGRFSSGPGGGGASAWSAGLEEEKQKVLQMKPAKQALYVLDHDGETYDNCVAAMENGTTEALVNNYFAIMAANGDPTPTKQTSDQLTYKLKDDVNGGKYDGYQEAREGYIQNMAGQSQAEAKASMAEFQKWFGGSWDSAETSILDKYIESDHVYDGKIYRGMKFDDAGYDAFMENISPGAQISMKRNSSWSSNEDVARNFGAHVYDDVNTVMVTCVKNRTSAPVAHLSTQGEDEVLAHSNAKWTVLHSETVVWPSGARKTYLTVVEAGE